MHNNFYMHLSFFLPLIYSQPFRQLVAKVVSLDFLFSVWSFELQWSLSCF